MKKKKQLKESKIENQGKKRGKKKEKGKNRGTEEKKKLRMSKGRKSNVIRNELYIFVLAYGYIKKLIKRRVLDFCCVVP